MVWAGCCKVGTITSNFVPAVELIYREISRPSSVETTVKSVAEGAKKIELTRADVDAIIQRRRTATPDELQQIIAQSKEFKLSDGERNQLGVDLSMAVAQRARRANAGREDPSAQFITNVLGMLETPYGLVDREWVLEQLRSGAEAIARCRDHRPPRCDCWATSRHTLWQAQHSEKSPESWAAAKIYDSLEGLEIASRLEYRGLYARP
jgi:hypothetical protein